MLELPPRLRAILAQEYPRFSDAEYARRHRALQAVMEAAGVDHLLVVTDHRTGNAPQWVTGWPGRKTTYASTVPGQPVTHCGAVRWRRMSSSGRAKPSPCTSNGSITSRWQSAWRATATCAGVSTTAWRSPSPS